MPTIATPATAIVTYVPGPIPEGPRATVISSRKATLHDDGTWSTRVSYSHFTGSVGDLYDVMEHARKVLRIATGRDVIVTRVQWVTP